ncbi:uncharacterized protein LOC122634250 isoform X1 [Vespula pensylvanica]|uniref:4Fe-4S ferredoxin-type domain-containing protein n=1 Tax=Vespula pensylvanica TaxID=30213 RepID=A0A834KLP6_VESPE|nr:uncharacterized protein LOC122634250 isoform X1 [Vespula pensylvanica]XP_043678936.1 uncharacterized protein LOC122634250 isoform X1 [Vespula pensylvanica]KAF7409018.1 hypothetical protein H0235_013870 [Vespula pensylvanica]
MENSRALVLVSLIFVIFSSIIWNESYTVKADSEATTTEENTSEEQKLILDCQHPNYRTYIKCLKYPSYKGNKVKRHHHEISPEMDHHCMEICVKSCEAISSHECNQKCSHCIRRAKHKHQIITEYETECIDGDCKGSEKPAVGTTNITTNIELNNVINTGTERPNGGATPPSQDNCNCTNCKGCSSNCCPPGGINGGNIGGGHGGGWGGGYGGGFGGGFQLSLVPQLSLGLGLSPSFGCVPPYHWFCYQPSPYHYPHEKDCSVCYNPVLRYKCDVSCQMQLGNSFPYTPRMKRDEQLCKSPHCIGGT